MTLADGTVAVFTIVNTLRFLAYVPQVTKALKDQSGAPFLSPGEVNSGRDATCTFNANTLQYHCWGSNQAKQIGDPLAARSVYVYPFLVTF